VRNYDVTSAAANRVRGSGLESGKGAWGGEKGTRLTAKGVRMGAWQRFQLHADGWTIRQIVKELKVKPPDKKTSVDVVKNWIDRV
jgi:hypothetical protein